MQEGATTHVIVLTRHLYKVTSCTRLPWHATLRMDHVFCSVTVLIESEQLNRYTVPVESCMLVLGELCLIEVIASHLEEWSSQGTPLGK